jgi:hypothetical protein
MGLSWKRSWPNWGLCPAVHSLHRSHDFFSSFSNLPSVCWVLLILCVHCSVCVKELRGLTIIYIWFGKYWRRTTEMCYKLCFCLNVFYRIMSCDLMGPYAFSVPFQCSKPSVGAVYWWAALRTSASEVFILNLDQDTWISWHSSHGFPQFLWVVAEIISQCSHNQSDPHSVQFIVYLCSYHPVLCKVPLQKPLWNKPSQENPKSFPVLNNLKIFLVLVLNVAVSRRNCGVCHSHCNVRHTHCSVEHHTVMFLTRMFVLALKRAACVQSSGRAVVLGGSWPIALSVWECSTDATRRFLHRLLGPLRLTPGAPCGCFLYVVSQPGAVQWKLTLLATALIG